MSKPLSHEQIKPQKIRYYLERRDEEFEQKMAEVLCVYRQAQVLKKAAPEDLQYLYYPTRNTFGRPECVT